MSESCLICGGREFSQVFRVERFPLVIGAIPAENRDVRESPLSIAACRRCSLVQQVSRLDKDAIELLYSADYYSCPSPLSTGMGAAEIDEFHDFFTRCGLKPAKLLEIACFDGYLLSKLNDNGWDVHGIDPAGQTKAARERLGAARIRQKFFKAGSYPDNAFDVVIARNFLEHVFDLHEFLGAVSKCLKADGRIFIEVPNVKTTLSLGVFGSFFHQHISYFSKETLSAVLAMHGFVPEHCDEGHVLMMGARKSLTADRSQRPPPAGKDAMGLIDRFVENSGKMRERIIGLFSDSANRSMALFGASAISTMIVSLLKEEQLKKLRFIYDNDHQKTGKFIHGCRIPISSPAKIKGDRIDALIIASYQFEREIREQLVKAGFPGAKIKSLFGMRDGSGG